MPNPEVRRKASMTNEQGVLWINSILKEIESCPKLLKVTFGSDVKDKLISMRAHLKDGGIFTERMEDALRGWNLGVLKWTRRNPPKRDQ